MFLALREMRRHLVRFALLASAIALLGFLVLFQQALQSGLLGAFVGGLRHQSAPVLVYAVDSQRTLAGSIITPDLVEAVATVDGIGERGRLGLVTVTMATADGVVVDAGIVGSDTPSLGWPEVTDGRAPELPGEVIGSDVDFAVGDSVTVIAASGGADVELTVVGVAAEVQLNVTATVFTDFDTYEAAARALNPDLRAAPVSAVTVRPVEGVSAAEMTELIDAAVPDAEALTRTEAADTAPGVGPVRQSFRVIFVLYALVVPLVIGLFFLIVTLQKSRSLTLLRAIGARRVVLVRTLLIEVVAVTAAGLAVGTGVYAAVARGRLGELVVRYDPGAVRAWSAAFLALAVAGALVSLRRVLGIDPVEAATGGGAR
ncbi:MAG: ABC transporter permease [Desertimonas sp.]